MDLQQYLADISLKAMSQLHRAIVHLTGGQVLGSAFGMPVRSASIVFLRVRSAADQPGERRVPNRTGSAKWAASPAGK